MYIPAGQQMAVFVKRSKDDDGACEHKDGVTAFVRRFFFFYIPICIPEYSHSLVLFDLFLTLPQFTYLTGPSMRLSLRAP